MSVAAGQATDLGKMWVCPGIGAAFSVQAGAQRIAVRAVRRGERLVPANPCWGSMACVAHTWQMQSQLLPCHAGGEEACVNVGVGREEFGVWR